MKEYVINLTRHQIDECGHWTPQEKPNELSAALIKWLDQQLSCAALKTWLYRLLDLMSYFNFFNEIAQNLLRIHRVYYFKLST